MSSTVYADAFEGARPTLTYNAVSSRLHLSKALTTDLASYYAERAAVEDVYIKSLQKLSSRLHSSSNNAVMTSIDSLGYERKEVDRQLGAWKGIQKQLENEVEEKARTSEAWRKKVVEEVEVPLRNSLNKPEWLRYSLLDQTLGGNVREYENTLDKVQKAQSKGGSKASKSTTSKLLSAQSNLSNLGSTLTSSLPSFLNTAQALDSSHSAFLKEALIRYGTINSDIGREQMEVGERMLVSVLGVDEQSEMQGFALREAQKAGARGVGSRNNVSNSTSMGSSQNSRVEPAIGEFGARNDSHQREAPILEEETVRTSSTIRERRPEPSRTTSVPRSAPPPVGSLALPTSALPTPSPAKSSSGGFKLSSFMKRDRAPSNAASSRYGNLDVPSSSVGGNPAGTYSTDNFDRQSIDSRTSEQPEEATPAPPASFARTNSNGLSAPARDRPTSMFGGKKRDSLMPFGGSLFRKGTVKSPAVEKNQNDGGLTIPGLGGSRGRSDSDARSARSTTDRSFQEQPEPARYSNALGASTSTMMSGGESTVDSEGFSVPPAGYDKQPWESNGNANLMDDDEDEISPLPPPKLPALSIAPLTISESSSERQAALERVKSTLLSSKPTNAGPSVSPLGIAPLASGLARRTTRGRRDGRMSTYSPVIPDDVPLGRILEQQRERDSMALSGVHDSSTGAGAYAEALPSSPIVTSFGNDGARRSDSIVSSVSSSSRMGTRGGIDPFETATTPGLRASIVETVNVLSKAGDISRVMIVGELSLSNRVMGGNSGPLKIRLLNFDRFEKSVPNHTYLSPIFDSPGDFIVQEALGASTTTVMKYQLRIPEGEEKHYLPLLVRASWKVEVGSAKVMIVYEGNSGAKLIAAAEASPFGEEEEGGSIQFDELSFHVPFSLSLSTFQSKPSAQYSADKNRLTFVPEDKTLVGGDSRKLLVSAVTDGSGVVNTPPISVHWKITGKVVSGMSVEVVEGGRVEEVATSIVSGKFLVAQ